jgi:hypothetical protein
MTLALVDMAIIWLLGVAAGVSFTRLVQRLREERERDRDRRGES